MEHRRDGFLAAMPGARLLRSSYGIMDSPLVIDRALATCPKLTAIAFDNDIAAGHAIWNLATRSLRVPEDISVTRVRQGGGIPPPQTDHQR